MGGKSWTSEETIIVLFFASRGVDHEGCAKILQRKFDSKGGPRSMIAVRTRLDEMKEGLWEDGTGWAQHQVDNWISSQNADVRTLVSAGNEEVACVTPVRSSLVTECQC